MYCGASSPASQNVQTGGGSNLTGGEIGPGEGSEGGVTPPVPNVTCPQCGRPLSEINFRPPEYGDVPVEIGTKLVPKGMEIISLHGGLELRLPPWCGDFKDYPYLGLVLENHISALRGTFGARAKNLQGGWGAGPYDSWDRFARLALVEPTVSYYGTANQNLVTFKRYWLKPSLFYMILQKEKRESLLNIFPDGAYIAFADTQKLLDARNERMDEHWRVCHAVEGPGAYTPALGSSTISIQKRYNTIHNFIMEWVEYAAAGQGTFINANVINYKALKSHRKAPGMIYPVRMAVGAPIANNIYETRPGQIAGELFRYADDLKTLGEFTSGAVPTVAGGTEMSLKPTTYLSDKESALGRLFPAWLHLKEFWSDVKVLGVKEFSRWRTHDEQYSLIGADGEAQGRIIRLTDLNGNFDAYPETNEQFPVLWQQMQQVFMQLVTSQDPYIHEILSDLDNAAFGKAMLGLPDLYVPGEDDRLKQRHEIALLLTQKPTVGGMTVNPQTGQQQPQLMASIGIDWEDNDPIHELTVRKWAVSSEGLRAKVENPWGYKNVILHGAMHEQRRLMQHAQAAMAGGGGDGGTDAGNSEGPSGRGAGGTGKSSASDKQAGKAGGGGRSQPSDDSTAPGGASPIAQTEGIKSAMEASEGAMV
jgi:hypothetical protein